MKQGTLYAGRIKRAYAKHKSQVPDVDIPESDDPLRRLGIGIMGSGRGDAAGERAMNAILAEMVDWNDIRVSEVAEVAAAMRNAVTDGRTRCRRLINALQALYDREHCLSLDTLRSKGRRDARQYLETMPGVDEYATASVLLWSLGAHGIPVHDKLLEALHAANLVHPDATRAEVQAFLERHISATEAKGFCLRMDSFQAKKQKSATGSAKTKKKKAAKSTR